MPGPLAGFRIVDVTAMLTGPMATMLLADQGAGDGGTRPQFVRNAFCDKITGYTAAQAITAALLARERGAGGQHLRLSMLDAALAFLWPDMMTNQSLLDEDVTPLPPIAESYRFVETADGFVAIAGGLSGSEPGKD